MADLSIRGLDDDVRARLRVRAASHGRSMEAEARDILTQAVTPEHERPDLFRALLDRFGGLGGVELELPPRSHDARPVDLPE